MTTFTYEQITSVTEQVIKEQIKNSQNTCTRALREMHLNFATGAFFNWAKLTAGRHRPGDYDHLLNLIEEAEQCQ